MTIKETSNKNELNLSSKLYQKSVVSRIKEINWETGSKAPYVVELDPTSACDLACPGCISADLLNHGGFTSERLLEIGEELVQNGIKAVVLIGGGEPLNHPAIGQLIEYFGENDVQIGITTNGTKIEKYLDVIAQYASWTRVSVDAATSETFQYLRPSHSGRSKFDQVISGMRQLGKIKKGKMGYSYLLRTDADGEIAQNNINEIYQAAALARDIGCDYFEVKPSYNQEHFLVQHKQDLMKKAKEEVERLFELETNHFKILKSINLDFTLDNKNISQPKIYNTCPVSELRTLITPSGVYVCPYFRGRSDMRIGDLKNTDFKEMWHSNTRKSVMENLNPQVHCNMHCIRHESNLILLDMQKESEHIRTIQDFNRFI